MHRIFVEWFSQSGDLFIKFSRRCCFCFVYFHIYILLIWLCKIKRNSIESYAIVRCVYTNCHCIGESEWEIKIHTGQNHQNKINIERTCLCGFVHKIRRSEFLRLRTYEQKKNDTDFYSEFIVTFLQLLFPANKLKFFEKSRRKNQFQIVQKNPTTARRNLEREICNIQIKRKKWEEKVVGKGWIVKRAKSSHQYVSHGTFWKAQIRRVIEQHIGFFYIAKESAFATLQRDCLHRRQCSRS